MFDNVMSYDNRNDVEVLIIKAEISKDVVVNGMIEGILFSQCPSIARICSFLYVGITSSWAYSAY